MWRSPEKWPTWAWVALTVIGALLRVEFTIGGFSLAPMVALLAGSIAGSRRGAASQAWSLLLLLPLSVLTPLGGSFADWGYALGRVPAAWLAGRWAPRLGHGEQELARRLTLGVGAALVATGIATWEGPETSPQLRLYYLAVLGFAVVIAGWYAYRMVERPGRALGFWAAMVPAYLLGAGWMASLGGGAVDGVRLGLGDLLFHGILAHVPGDALAAVVVAYFTGAKELAPGPFSR